MKYTEERPIYKPISIPNLSLCSIIVNINTQQCVLCMT